MVLKDELRLQSPINELCAAYGKLFHEGSWICGNPACKHRYDPDMDGGGLTMEELHGSKRAGTWRCPKCSLSKTNVDPNTGKPNLVHTSQCFTYHREDTGTRTVCCLKLHPDDLHSEVRPQVLLKMRPRFSTVVNPKDGSLDPDFENQCETPDTIDLMEDTFGAQIKLELLIHEEIKEDIVYGGKCIGKARDVFALFRVAELSSWEHFSGEPTKLNKQAGSWRSRDDKKLFEMMTGSANAQLTNSQMAEMFGKTERQVDLRRRFLKRMHTSDEGWPVTPKKLRVVFQPHWRTTLRLWSHSRKDEAMKVVSCGYLWGILKAGCRCKHYSDPHERDMKRYISMQTRHILDNKVENRKDITELESKFLQENMALDDVIGKMKVQLVNSGKRHMVRTKSSSCRFCGCGGSRSMIDLYGDVGEKKMVTIRGSAEEGDIEVSVDEKLRRWMMSKYANEIDAVIVRNDEDEDDEGEDDALIVTPGGHRVRASSQQKPAPRSRTSTARFVATHAAAPAPQRQQGGARGELVLGADLLAGANGGSKAKRI